MGRALIVSAGAKLQRVYRRAAVRDGLQPPGDHSQRSRGAAQDARNLILS